MPIFANETTIYPDGLLHGLTTETSDRYWWALHTKSRQEKSLARQLLSRQIPFYLPLIPKDNRVRGRSVRSYVPLFSGYVFLYGNDTERITSLTTNRIVQILPVHDQERLGHDLQQVRQLIESDAPLSVERRLAPGQGVRIKAGPLSGLEGTVISRRANPRLLVSVNMLQQGVSLEIDDFLLEVRG